MPNISKIVKGVAKAKAKFKPAKPPVKPMTKTVISYDKSTKVKVLKPGSRPRTQSATELKAVVERSKTKTPAAKASIKSAANNDGSLALSKVRNNRQGRLNDAMREAWQTNYNKPLTPAQIKAGNKAYAARAKELKASYAAAKKAAVAAAKRAAAEERRAYIKKYGVPKKY